MPKPAMAVFRLDVVGEDGTATVTGADAVRGATECWCRERLGVGTPRLSGKWPAFAAAAIVAAPGNHVVALAAYNLVMAPTSHESIDLFVSRVLHTLLGRHGALQVFLFGPAGEPFWCARKPLSSEDMVLLQHALNLIGRLEAEKPKPFIGHDASGRFSVAALGRDSDLFVVCVNHSPDRLAAEARVALVRDDLLPRVGHLRNGEMRVAAGYGER